MKKRWQHYDKRRRRLIPALADLAPHRAETLQDLKRYDEAVAIFESRACARDPADPHWHHDFTTTCSTGWAAARNYLQIL